ncbi:protein VACUOLELESS GAMETOPHYTES-like [Magnolia sinica]|uniref:protein VACUOLELESS GAMETOPHYTES-like n=1 Tax=Magnolia sinica TaxID=86752 RepID=UPI00265AC293|nr:protein VACUOLELESS GAMETOPHYTES-like [Magnolia sinica]
MGKLSNDATIQHFSHPHPLELVQLSTIHFPASPCAGCKLKASSWIYACKPCNYVLHITCSQMPQLINHPSDPHHPLSLFPLPAYPEGFFNCDACSRRGNGFSYHCGVCDLDIHILCASMPLSVSHPAHHHPLNLVFFPPYESKGFSCDICENLGASHWLYRCSTCEFDAHMVCATAKPRPTVQAQNQYPQGIPQQQHQLLRPAANPQFQAPGDGLRNGPQQGYTPTYYVDGPSQGIHQAGPPAGGNGPGNSLADQTMQGFIDGTAQQAGESFMQGITGDGSGNGVGDGGGGDSSSGSIFSNLLGGSSGGSND